jgi:diguanylate cyclase (GGDEF)-like protein/PAS domain S-box-containing protein
MECSSSSAAHEIARLNSLKTYEISDTPFEKAFDDFTKLAAVICDAPIATLSFVDTDRVWFKSVVGLKVHEAPRQNSFCGQTIKRGGLFKVNNTELDSYFSDSPLVTGELGIRFYAGHPLISEDGYAIGTICVLDTKPRELSGPQCEALERLSHQIVLHLQHRLDLIRLDHMSKILHRTGKMAKVGGWELDLETQKLHWTKEVFEIHELEYGGVPSLEEALNFYDEAGKALLKREIASAVKNNTSWDYELPFTTAKNNKIWVRAHGYAIFSGKNAVRLVGAFQDITKSKQDQLKLTGVNNALHLIRQCHLALLHIKDERELVSEICRLIVDEAEYSFAWVGIIDPHSNAEITPIGFYGDGEAYLKNNHLSWSSETKIGNGPCGMAIRTGKTVRNDEIKTSQSEHTKLLREYGYSSIVSLPLMDDKRKVFGILGLYSTFEHNHSQEEIGLIDNLAQNLAIGISQIRKDIEHKTISQSISRLAETLSAVSNDDFFDELVLNMTSTLNADAGYTARLLHTPDLKLQTLSVVVDKILEPDFTYPISEPLFTALFEHDNVMFVRAGAFNHPIFKTLSLMRYHPYEAFAGFKLQNSNKKDFGLIFIFFKDKVSESQEKLVRSTISVFTSRTSSELERIEDALIIQERAALLDKSRDPMVVRDLNHRITYWNHAAELLYGWTEKEALNQKVDALLQINSESFLLGNSQTINYGEWFGESVEYHKNGKAMIVEVRSTLVRDKFGVPRSIFSIKNDITNKKLAENEIHRFAFYDALTNLPNRRLLVDKLISALTTTRVSNKIGAAIFIDLDKFKSLNDSYGHDEGDLLLQQVADRLSSAVRSGDIVARLGGDEFVILIDGISKSLKTSRETVISIAENIMHLFSIPFELQTTKFETRPSIGIRLFDRNDDDFTKVMKDADAAMYRAKHGGGNQYAF